MGKQRTSRPQAFKATAAATSEMKAHVGEKNTAGDFQKAAAIESQFAAGELAALVDDYLDGAFGARASQLIPLDGYPSLKLRVFK